MTDIRRALLVAAALGAGVAAGVAAGSAEPAAAAPAIAVAGVAAAGPERPTPSGLPVPRYVSLKFDKVNARAGPGDDHRVLWDYRVRGLPVQVIAETAEWRRICDPDGQLAWVHKRTTDGRRTTINMTAAPQPLYRRPKADSRVVAYLNPKAMAALVRCDNGWCRVRAEDANGWVPVGELWGTTDALQCRRGGIH